MNAIVHPFVLAALVDLHVKEVSGVSSTALKQLRSASPATVDVVKEVYTCVFSQHSCLFDNALRRLSLDFRLSDLPHPLAVSTHFLQFETTFRQAHA